MTQVPFAMKMGMVFTMPRVQRFADNQFRYLTMTGYNRQLQGMPGVWLSVTKILPVSARGKIFEGPDLSVVTASLEIDKNPNRERFHRHLKPSSAHHGRELPLRSDSNESFAAKIPEFSFLYRTTVNEYVESLIL